ncbi:S-4TM family putative pore-forming effector [Chryseobacterium sp. NKUCC03_KSP]|uniref:S-4TM family putative pore-forming effector n=1 Tax=Chryseobacterium sp. NKUCC03_KSP TaxID=2842125 RepID=UPI001C5AA8A5|nr:S-4TM family putative pore-forming effector [Chryseobacterium sp. NKUCC03_KSP]MBW3524692.1 hypothetical protein [Chryseobacterium sp. NKUCC03_KSP]
MNTIFTKQNQQQNIDKIAAFKQLYVEAKRAFSFLLILTVPVTVVIALLKILLVAIFKVDISAFVYIYSISLLICDLILMNFIITDYKKNAAKIQEDFDCSIYDLEWHKILVGKKPRIELINRYSEIYKTSKNNLEELKDWYPIELAHIDGLKAILLCQKTNLNYDTSVRAKFKVFIIKICLITFGILLLSALVGNVSFWNFITQLLMSFLPIFTVSAKIIIDQNKTIKNSEELKDHIENVIENESPITQKSIRSIQDKLYCNRKDSGLVPETYYKWQRKRFEEEMHKNAKSY